MPVPPPVDLADVDLQTALGALADPVRRAIVRQLAAVDDWALVCGEFDLPVSKATSSHHFLVLRNAGLLEQRPDGTRLRNRLRRPEFDARFPGLLDLVLAEPAAGTDADARSDGDTSAAVGSGDACDGAAAETSAGQA